MQDQYCYTLATESELNDLLAGTDAGIAVQWPGSSTVSHLPTGSTGVVWKRPKHPYEPLRPFMLVARDEEFRRLFGRFAQLRGDLSPLTAWCHLLSPQLFDWVESPGREPDLGGLEAAWTGLIVAEAQLLSEIPLASLRLQACLATQSFAIGRTKALWGDVSEDEISQRFDNAKRLFRGSPAQRGEIRTARVRAALQPIWASLIAVSQGVPRVPQKELLPIVASLRGLQEARRNKDVYEGDRLIQPLLDSVPEAHILLRLSNLAPEQRLKVFDQIVDALNAMNESKLSLRRVALTLLAGYMATIAAGGKPSLSLAESNAARWPEIAGWAYVLGGIGERVIWTSSFDGLGRLVARELMRELRLDEPPTCDFALDEAMALVDSRLPDPFVHLRIKQGRIATIALLPGVNTSISITELVAQEARPQQPQPTRQADPIRPNRNIASIIADAIWPFLRTRVEDLMASAQDDYFESQNQGAPRNKRRSASHSQLPLRGSKK